MATLQEVREAVRAFSFQVLLTATEREGLSIMGWGCAEEAPYSLKLCYLEV